MLIKTKYFCPDCKGTIYDESVCVNEDEVQREDDRLSELAGDLNDSMDDMYWGDDEDFNEGVYRSWELDLKDVERELEDIYELNGKFVPVFNESNAADYRFCPYCGKKINELTLEREEIEL